MNLNKLITLPLITLLVSGCGLTYKVLLGVDTTPKWNTDEQIVKQAKKYKIPPDYNLVLDTATYRNDLKNIYTIAFEKIKNNDFDSSHYYILKKARNDDRQPAQFRLFDQNGIEIFKIVNCYIDPPIPLNWNVDGCFDSFPPATHQETLNIHLFDLDFLLDHAHLINQNKLAYNELPKADYYGVIVWNECFKRPSRRLIKTVRNYVEKSGKSIALIYINSQNQLIWSALDARSKEKIKARYSTK